MEYPVITNIPIKQEKNNMGVYTKSIRKMGVNPNISIIKAHIPNETNPKINPKKKPNRKMIYASRR